MIVLIPAFCIQVIYMYRFALFNTNLHSHICTTFYCFLRTSYISYSKYSIRLIYLIEIPCKQFSTNIIRKISSC
nr:MAG TPA: hypothetical protein [Bacteriophage sp.]